MTIPPRKTHLDATAISLLLACCLFWGFQQVMVKATLPELPPVFQAAVRFLGATILLLCWCKLRGVSLIPPNLHDRSGLLKSGLMAGLLFSGEFAFLYVGLQHTTASRLTVFLYTSPFWVALLLPVFVASEKLRTIQWMGLGCAFVAVVFALWDGLSTASNSPLWMGDVMGLIAGLMWGLTTVVIRSGPLVKANAEQLLFYQIAVAAVTLPLLSLALGEKWPASFSMFASASLLIQTVLGAFASYLAWMWMLGRYPATKISVFVFLTPLFALLFGNLWLNEPLTLALLISMGLVAVGIVLVNRKA